MRIAELPYFMPLVKDYVSNFTGSHISEFFAKAPIATVEDLAGLAASQVARFDPAVRNSVCDAVEQLHAKLDGLSEHVRANLELLRKPETVAVVTGQQVGILGGPIYTMYKTITAVALARAYKVRCPEYNFVPVFWLETEDHDLAEVASSVILNKNAELQTIRYAPTLASDPAKEKPWRKQVGPTIPEEAAIGTMLSDLEAALPVTEFTAEIMGILRSCYGAGWTFAEAFASLLICFFADDGLLVLDANSKELKTLGIPLFRRELETSPKLSEQIVLESVRIEDSYHAQVKPRAINLFYVGKDGERLAITERERTGAQGADRSFFLAGTRQSFTLAELLADLEANPERFSPNVVMRPLYQDTILPTVAYVAGPGEIAYLAQLKQAYQWAGLTMPIIAPRVTATLVAEPLDRILEKYRLTAEGVLSDGREGIDRFLSAMSDPELPQSFEHALAAIDQSLEALRPKVDQAEPTLNDALTSVKGKMLTTLRDFQNKTLAAERKRFSTVRAQCEKLLTVLLPGDGLQERELGIIYFVNKYGLGFLDVLKEAVSERAEQIGEHHVLHLGAMRPAEQPSTEKALIHSELPGVESR